MTTEELAELARLEAAATPGPWGWEAEDGSLLTLGTAGDMLRNHVLSCPRCKSCQKDERTRCLWPRKDDADFIAALRNAARGLLAAAEENARLRAEHEDFLAWVRECMTRDVRDLKGARQEVERLRAALQQMADSCGFCRGKGTFGAPDFENGGDVPGLGPLPGTKAVVCGNCQPARAALGLDAKEQPPCP